MGVHRYKKMPVTIEAVQWTGKNEKELAEFCGDSCRMPLLGVLMIRTLEGEIMVRTGDYIIRGVAGEFYPCKPEIFNATYEKEEGV